MLSASWEQQFSREVCGNKLLMCFLFVAERSYQETWHKLFGLFRNLATFHSVPAVQFPFLSISRDLCRLPIKLKGTLSDTSRRVYELAELWSKTLLNEFI